LKKRGIATKACGYFDDSESGVPSISFLGHESAVFTNLVPDSDGQISIELEGHAFFDGLKDSSSVFEVTILAWDKSQFTSKSTSMRIDVNKNSPSKIPCRDIRLSEEEALTSNGSEKYLQTQNHECLLPGQSIELARSYSTKFALYDRLASAFDLWSAFCSDTMEVMSLTKDLKRWFQLDVKAKLDLYPSLAGSEVDFFLYMKDRVFFDRFIKPIIHGKISKSLIDYFLLDDVESLKKRYLNMGIYEQLNYVERLLLASKLPVELSIQICERVSEDIVADYPKGPRPIVLRNVFSTLLSRGAIAPSLLSPSLPCTRKTPPLPPPSPCASRGMPCAAPMSFSTRMRSSGLGNAYDDRIAGESTFDTSMDEEYVDVNRDDVESDSDGVESMTDISDETRVNEDLTESLKKKARGEKSEERAYIPPGKVRMVQEKRFYMDKKPSFSGNNMFWKEYADHIIKCKQKAKKAVSFSKLFVSSYFPEALSGFTEGLMALSVMDLALNPKSMEISNLSPSKLALKSENTSIIYHQSIEPWDNQTDSLSDQESSESTSLVVKQTLYNPEDAETTSRGFPTKRISEFVINTVYACFVCVSNIGESTISNINLLMQIPRGSIPLGEKSFYTRNETLELDPNQTKVFNFLFYFPAHGIYTHFQSQLAIDGRVVCSASNSSDKKKHIIEVLSKPSSYVDLTSWDDVCRRGNL
jgi:hypothetical protein